VTLKLTQLPTVTSGKCCLTVPVGLPASSMPAGGKGSAAEPKAWPEPFMAKRWPSVERRVAKVKALTPPRASRGATDLTYFRTADQRVKWVSARGEALAAEAGWRRQATAEGAW
jgi:hypothetical protein